MLGLFLVILTRIISAIIMFFFPITGYLLTVFTDVTDLWILLIFNSAFNIHYNIIDKIIDFFTLTIALIISLKFDKILKNTSIFLYIWRLIGFFLFFLINNKFLLFLFPNIFENFFLFCIIQRKFFVNFKITKKNIWYILILVTLPKLFHEWFLHVSGNDMKVYEWVSDTVNRLGWRYKL